ncbi:TPA: hypothetical protein DCE37_23100 [Candidatus Latescibacteria bacterium]|nr:hypothetical protein [Candidatus Latescibacterota bacterium]
MTDRLARRIIAALGLVYAAIVAVTHRDYGINLDEMLHVDYGRSVVDWYLSGFTVRHIFSYTNIWLYGGLYDTIVHLITLLVPYDLFHTRHLVNAAVGFVGVVGAYELAKTIGKSPRAGLIAACMLLLIPRYYGHVLFNHKDIPFAVGYVWSLCLILKSMDSFPRVPLKTAVLTGAAIGATCGIRVAGAILGLYYLLAVALILRPECRYLDWRACFRTFGLTGIVAWALMIVCWPWVHANPITRPALALTMISDFPFNISTLFDGQVYLSSEIPWYYAPKWLLIAVPEFLLVGIIVTGIEVFLRRSAGDHPLIFGLFGALFPVVYVVLTDASLYNGMRHLLLVVPPLCAVAAVATDRLIDRGQPSSRFTLAIIVLSVLLTLVDTIRLHPNQYVYFNRLLGGGLASAASRYDTDYFGNSHGVGIKWLEANTDAGTTVHSGSPGITSGTSLEHKGIPWHADYVLRNVRTDGRLEVGGDVVHVIRTMDVPMLNIIRRDPAWRGGPLYHGPEAAGHYASLAGTHGYEGDVDRAVDLYRKAIEARPGQTVWHYKFGRLLIDSERWAEAIPELEQAVAILPSYAGHFHLASCYQKVGRFQDAIDSYQRAIEIRFDSEWAWLNLGGSLGGQRRFEEAEHAYRQALRYHPGLVNARERLAQLYVEQERFDEAIPILNRLITESNSSTHRYLRARVHYSVGEYQGALTHLRHSVEDLDRNDAWLLYVASLRRTTSIEEAYQVLTRLVARPTIDPQILEEYLSVGAMLHQAGDLRKAEEVYETFLDLSPGSDRGWHNLGILLYATSRFEEAATAFSNVVEITPTAGALLGLGQAQEKLGKRLEAERTYRRTLDVDPENEAAQSHLEALQGKPR